MRVVIVGQKWLAAEILKLCIYREYDVAAVIAPGQEDRLYQAGIAYGRSVLSVPGRLAPEHIPADVDVIVAAHAHCFISRAARDCTRLGAIGYHPSLLPRHRGRDAIRWAIHMREATTGGTVYWMDDRADGGPVAAQDWCHIRPDDTPETLWRRELAPMGLRLLAEVLQGIDTGQVKSIPQDNSLATWEPSFDRQKLVGCE